MIGIISVTVFWAAFVLPIKGLVPVYTTEEVTIVEKNKMSCVIETQDGFLITTPDCDGQKGDVIKITYGVNKKKFSSWTNP